MSFPNSEILRDMFHGFQSTPLLWRDKKVYGLEQFLPSQTTNTFFKDTDNNPNRLGNWVEKFVAFQIRMQNGAELIDENIKIVRNKQTIGELDLLLKLENQPIHLEIAYKFYLLEKYDLDNPLENWIGPNRKDNLVFKLNKLREKQFPLLYAEEANSIHDKLNNKTIKQYTCFKGQLYVPFNSLKSNIAPLNPECIFGEYFNFDFINNFKNYRFYIPSKLEWLCQPRMTVNWLEFEIAKKRIENCILNKRSVLCWLNSSDNKTRKIFITWW